MTKEQRLSYELDGVQPLAATSIASEDYDPTPVPQGCPRCFMTGSDPCKTCPDPDVKAKRRKAIAEGLVLVS